MGPRRLKTTLIYAVYAPGAAEAELVEGPWVRQKGGSFEPPDAPASWAPTCRSRTLIMARAVAT